MDSAIAAEGERLFDGAVAALAIGETPAALAKLERALKLKDDRSWYSYLGYCIAKERGQVKRGMDLCNASLEADAGNPAHFLNMAKIHLLAGSKVEALTALRNGMSVGGNDEIKALLNKIGTRKPPVIAKLPRSHPLNRYLGLLRDRLGMR
ncbi:hypothetical protein LPW11_22100 [Geomonas sp. RF6]|uniref:hypothetical protein n=1 Tax=Geomonas sp. RF6 TaxID=2897342 RepID=UPI001E3494BD|nr:hypothetical protein [Geomonas sp. RF6]UFS70548.1 hypothetical protein LPW11_22100 [Geomonas sp. RF6]